VAFARWDPIRDLLAIQQHLNRFDQRPAGWVPAVDVHETAESYVVTAEVPGLRRDDLHIHFHDGRLTVSGTRRERGPAYEKYHRVERGYGEFSRTFQLPLAVEADAIAADLTGGVLTIVVPKSAQPAPRRIRVS
jgi:HSP20 family protein